MGTYEIDKTLEECFISEVEQRQPSGQWWQLAILKALTCQRDLAATADPSSSKYLSRRISIFFRFAIAAAVCGLLFGFGESILIATTGSHGTNEYMITESSLGGRIIVPVAIMFSSAIVLFLLLIFRRRFVRN